MGFWGKLLKTGASIENDVENLELKKQGQTSKNVEIKYKQQIGFNHQDSNGNPGYNALAIGGKTVDEWEKEWKSIGLLCDLNLNHYHNYVGVYREWLNEEIIYIGKAIEWSNGGFKERLTDYTRSSRSAIIHKSQQRIHDYSNQIYIDIIITGSHEENAKVATQLEARLIEKYHPEGNVMSREACSL